MKRIVEVCCGSYYDAKQAFLGGAQRIELNSALHLGGLTPTLATLELVKEEMESLKVAAMVRPRGGGFCYNEEDFRVMLAECKGLVSHGADGVVFGCLKSDRSLDLEQNHQLIHIIKNHGKEAIFHRAFDCCENPYETIELLIELGVDRILTSGLKPKAMEGIELIEKLQKQYGEYIELLPGSGMNASNAKEMIDRTGVSQVHSSCKGWKEDATTISGAVSYSFAAAPYEICYDVVSRKLVEQLVKSIEE